MITRLDPEAVFLQQLDDYVGLFRNTFRRRDQARWAAVYLQGLLRSGSRKNMETLARGVVLPPALPVADVAQALQNFVNQSPWDEQQLWRGYRALLQPHFAAANGIFLIEDLDFPKQGRHSVGVHRQYSSSLGRKINCQSAVSLHYLSTAGYCPLVLRLYLPRHWLHAPERLDATAVPLACRHSASRVEIALELLDTVRAEGWPGVQVAGGSRYGTSQHFRDGLGERDLSFGGELGGERCLAEEGACQLREELGLDHFEGRSWRGFHHHACLVMLAYGFRVWSRGRRAVERMG